MAAWWKTRATTRAFAALIGAVTLLVFCLPAHMEDDPARSVLNDDAEIILERVRQLFRRTLKASSVDLGAVTVVTIGRQETFRDMRNLVGSVQFWEPLTVIAVYDVGLTPYQVYQVQNWIGVDYIRVPLSDLPQHMRSLDIFAWRPLVLTDAVERYGRILWQDEYQEIRMKWDDVTDLFAKRGYFFTITVGPRTNFQCCGRIGEVTSNEIFNHLHLSSQTYLERFLISSATLGFEHSYAQLSAYRQVLIPTLSCAFNESCYLVSDPAHHSFDQSILSILAHAHHLEINTDPRFWANGKNSPQQSFSVPLVTGVPIDPMVDNGIILYSRRGAARSRFPYETMVRTNATIETTLKIMK